MLNRTPHAVVLFLGDTTHTFPEAGVVARATSLPQEPVAPFAHEGVEIPCVTPPNFGGAEGIDGEEPILVSALVAPIAAKLRTGVFSPDSGPGSVVRDGQGQILGVRRLIRWS